MHKFITLAAAGLALVPLSAAHAGGAAGAGLSAGALQLVPMDELRVPIVDGDRADGTLRFKLVLLARDAAGAKRLTDTLPMLRATALAQGIEFARLYASPMSPVDAGRLSAVLTTALQAQDSGVARVLIVEVAAR